MSGLITVLRLPASSNAAFGTCSEPLPSQKNQNSIHSSPSSGRGGQPTQGSGSQCRPPTRGVAPCRQPRDAHESARERTVMPLRWLDN